MTGGKVSSDSVAEGIKEIVKDLYLKGKNGPGPDIRLDHRLSEDLGFDSMEVLELIVRIEKKFKVRIEDEDFRAELFNTVQTVADWVIKLHNA